MKSALAAVVFALLLPIPGQAQGRPAAQFALIIGANRSVDMELRPLKYADDDAARYFELFQALGIETHLLSQFDESTRRLHPMALAESHDPNFRQLNDAVSAIAQQVARAKGNGLKTVFYFVFAGHGNFKDKGYLTLPDKRITGEQLFEDIVDPVDAGETHLIIDACYSYFLAYGRGPGAKRRPVSGFSQVNAGRRNVGFLLSTSAANESHEWDAFQAGIFSHEIRSGLYGAADVDGNGTISYKEIAAFVTHANSSIPSDKYRPKLFAKPPADTEQLIDLRPGLDGALALTPSKQGPKPGHTLLEDSRGVRILDFNSGAGAVKLVRPISAKTLYLRHIDSEMEFVIPPPLLRSKKTIAIAKLTPKPRRSQGRGAAHHAFSKIFERPFDKYVVTAYRYPKLELPEIPDKQPQVSRTIPNTRPDPADSTTVATRQPMAQLPAKNSGSTLVVMDLEAGANIQKGESQVLTNALIQSVGKRYRGKVSSMAEIRSWVDAQTLQQITGCVDERCMADTSSALAVDGMLTGRVSKLNDQTLVFLALIEPRLGSVKARTSYAIDSDNSVLSEMDKGTETLFTAEAQERGDLELTELRVALVSEEYDHNGKPRPVQIVEPCISKSLLAHNVQLVSPAMVDVIKKQATMAQLQAGSLPTSLSNDHVDLVIATKAQFSVEPSRLRLQKCRSEIALSMIRIDTGEILLSEQQSAYGVGHTVSGAVGNTATKTCPQAADVLRQALGKLKDRGNRVMVELIGPNTRSGVEQLAGELKGVNGVAKVKIRKYGRNKSTLDLVVLGGDGIALAIDLGRGKISGTVIEASPTLVRLERETE